MRHVSVVLACALVAASATAAHASIVWTTSAATDVNFTKNSGADPTLPANQDHITPSVAITRATTMGLYNAVSQAGFVDGSPFGTEWAAANLNNNPDFAYGSGAAMHNSLVFSDWETAFGGQALLKNNILTEPAVLHIKAEDIYLDIKFTSWGGSASGGAFSLTRASGPVPEPASLAFLAVGGLALLVKRR